MKLEVGVKALITDNNGRYLFVKYTDTPDEAEKPRWDIPGGRLKPEETLVEALARELKTQLKAKLLNCAVLSAQDILLPNIDLHVVRVTYQTQIQGDLRIGAVQGLYRWAAPDEALTLNVDSYLHHTLELLKQAR